MENEEPLLMAIEGTTVDWGRHVQVNAATGEIFDFTGNKIYPEFRPSRVLVAPDQVEPSAVTENIVDTDEGPMIVEKPIKTETRSQKRKTP